MVNSTPVNFYIKLKTGLCVEKVAKEQITRNNKISWSIRYKGRIIGSIAYKKITKKIRRRINHGWNKKSM